MINLLIATLILPAFVWAQGGENAAEGETASEAAASDVESDKSEEAEGDAEADEAGPGALKEVRWYMPELRDSNKKGMRRVMISGSTSPGAKIKIGSKTIPIERGKKVKKLRAKRAIVSKKLASVTVGESGLFVYPVNLPTGKIRLPIVVKYKDGFKQNYQLNLQVTKESVELTNQEDLIRSPAFLKKYEVWGGAGFNYVRYEQESSDISSDLLFETFKLPSFYLKGRANIYRNWDLIYTYKLSPGETSSGEEVTVNQGTYDWQTHTLEGKVSPSSWQTKIFKNTGQWAIRFGLQNHLVPFISRSADSVADVETNSIMMASVGGQYQEMISPKWDFEFYMRLQHPLSTGDEFDINSSFAFDGSVGMIYNFKGGLKLGGFWYGQLQTYEYTTTDAVTDAEITGDQTLFYSNIDVRVGYAFD